MTTNFSLCLKNCIVWIYCEIKWSIFFVSKWVTDLDILAKHFCCYSQTLKERNFLIMNNLVFVNFFFKNLTLTS